jgi:hypothetical protein
MASIGKFATSFFSRRGELQERGGDGGEVPQEVSGTHNTHNSTTPHSIMRKEVKGKSRGNSPLLQLLAKCVAGMKGK